MIPVVGTRISDACAAEFASAFIGVPSAERQATIALLRADAASFRGRQATPHLSARTLDAISISYDAVAAAIEALPAAAEDSPVRTSNASVIRRLSPAPSLPETEFEAGDQSEFGR